MHQVLPCTGQIPFCGLCASGLTWHETFADCLQEMGFPPIKAEPDAWMRDIDGSCECVAVCINTLAIASNTPLKIVRTLEDACKFNLQDAGPTNYHLGMDFFRDEDGALCFAPRKHMQR